MQKAIIGKYYSQEPQAIKETEVCVQYGKNEFIVMPKKVWENNFKFIE